MKKILVMTMLVVMMIIVATTTVFAAGNLADQIYSMGKTYGVTAEHKVEMERYFNQHPATEEQENYVISKAKEAIAVMESAGVKDVTKLSEADLKKVQNLVKDAANKLGLKIEFSSNGVKIAGASGEKIKELTFTPSPDKTTSNAKSSTKISSKGKYVYTGANYTSVAFTIASIVAIVIAGSAVVKLRRNA